MGVLTLNVNILEVIVNNGKQLQTSKNKACTHLYTSYDDIIKKLSTSYPQIEDNLCKRHKYWFFCGKIFDILCV